MHDTCQPCSEPALARSPGAASPHASSEACAEPLLPSRPCTPPRPLRLHAFDEDEGAASASTASGECSTDEPCAVCLSPIRARNPLKTLCGHVFHRSCLVECRVRCLQVSNALGGRVALPCPLCRAPLEPGLTPVNAPRPGGGGQHAALSSTQVVILRYVAARAAVAARWATAAAA